jgi:hypothetical protein
VFVELENVAHIFDEYNFWKYNFSYFYLDECCDNTILVKVMAIVGSK